MDINAVWDKMVKEKFAESKLETNAIREAIQHESQSISQVLKKRLMAKIYWILFFLALFSGGMIYDFGETGVTWIFALAFIIYSFGGVVLFSQYRKMSNSIDLSEDCLSVMKTNLNKINSALRYENLIFIPIYPIMIIGGMLFSKIQEGYTIIEAFSEPRFLIMALVAVGIVTPILFYLGGKMNDIAYGDFIRKLKTNVSKLEMIS